MNLDTFFFTDMTISLVYGARHSNFYFLRVDHTFLRKSKKGVRKTNINKLRNFA